MSQLVQEILEFCEETGLEIVSYGLAPNPDGFCFEAIGEPEDEQQLSEMLSDLNSAEERELKSIIFGSQI